MTTDCGVRALQRSHGPRDPRLCEDEFIGSIWSWQYD
jgi:hypothetical protein